MPEQKIQKYWIHYGFSWKRFAIGISIDTYSLNIDFLFFWFGMEW
jgi:hypothetical protein